VITNDSRSIYVEIARPDHMRPTCARCALHECLPHPHEHHNTFNAHSPLLTTQIHPIGGYLDNGDTTKRVESHFSSQNEKDAAANQEKRIKEPVSFEFVLHSKRKGMHRQQIHFRKRPSDYEWTKAKVSSRSRRTGRHSPLLNLSTPPLNILSYSFNVLSSSK